MDNWYEQMNFEKPKDATPKSIDPDQPFEEWRKQEGRNVQSYENWARYAIRQRINVGHENYRTGEPGSQFMGDPIDHATEEAFDLPYYLRYAKLRHNAMAELLQECYDFISAVDEDTEWPGAKELSDKIALILGHKVIPPDE